MKGKIIVKDEKWYVEIQSDLHGYGIGWGDSKVYPLLITDENIWAGKEVEVEPVHYDSNFIPVIVKIKEVVETTVVNTMPKNEDGKPFVNTMPMIEVNKPIKLYDDLQISQSLRHYNISESEISKIISFMEPIELPFDGEVYNMLTGNEGNAIEEQILNQNK